MSTGLNVNRVVNVTVNLSPKATPKRNFGAFLIVGSSTVIDTVERLREFDGLDSVATSFGTTSPEYLMAVAFFSQAPQPSLCYVGRWAQTATAALLHGAILTPTQQLLANFTATTAGAFLVSVDGVPYALTGLNFSTATNLNGIAAIIQTALQTAGASGARVVWGAINQRFDVISGTTGIASSLSYASAPTAIDSITFPANPTANDTVTFNGTVVTFKASGAVGSQVNIGVSLTATLAALFSFLNSSTDTQILKFRFAVVGSKLYVIAAAPGTGGNALTLTASVATVATPTLAGGTGTDVSVLLGLSILPTTTGSNANPPVAGIAAETLLSAITTLADKSGLWYGVSVATTTPPADADHLAVAAFIEGTQQSRVYVITTQNTTVLDPTRSDDLSSVLMSLIYSRTFIQYSSSNPYAAASLFGRFATINYNGSNTVITGKFKQEPGIAPELLSASQADTLEGKNCNVFVTYQNATQIIEQAVMSNGYFIDERITADWYQNALQVDLFNELYTSTTKVPQTDDGQGRLLNRCNNTSQAAKTNGWIAPGIWNADGFGNLNQGDRLQTGYYFWSDSYDNQSQADREARNSMPIQGAGKLAGAVHFIDCPVVINR